MSTLLEFINNNHALKRLYDYLESGFSTTEVKIFLPNLQAVEIDGDMMSMEHVQQLQKKVADNMTSHDFSRRDIAELTNIISVYGQTAIKVQSETVSDKEINMGWATRFYDYVKNIYDIELQSLWSKLLVQEIKQPNFYYKRTLDVLYKADKFEIEWFFDVTKFVCDKAFIPEFVLSENKFYPFNQFQTLIDAGFVNASPGNLSYKDVVTIKLTSADFKIEVLSPPVMVRIYTLTDAGSQLFDLKARPNTNDFLDKLKEMLERNKRAKVLAINSK